MRPTLRYITSAKGAAKIHRFFTNEKVMFASVDVFYSCKGEPVSGKDYTLSPSDIEPIALSLAVGHVKCVVDLRCQGVLPFVAKIMKLPIPFVGHELKHFLFCLWKLGIREPTCLWDTRIFEQLLALGQFNRRYFDDRNVSIPDQISSQDSLKADKKRLFEIKSICRRYAVPYFRNVNDDFFRRQIVRRGKGYIHGKSGFHSLTMDAVANAKLFLIQFFLARERGLLRHAQEIEMPFVVTNAQMEWEGLRISSGNTKLALAKLKKVEKNFRKQLKSYGIDNLNNNSLIESVVSEKGLSSYFFTQGYFSLDHLKNARKVHPLINILYKCKRNQRLLKSIIDLKVTIQSDNRIHPNYEQLGTDTGRLTCTHPNILGMNKRLRPIIGASKGYLIGEIDYSQFEVALAAGYYKDQNLIMLYNAGDVYVRLAKVFFKLPSEARSMSDKAFKKKYPDLREQMKTCVLGMLNGMTSDGFSKKLNCNTDKAEKLHRAFRNMFPDLVKAMEKERFLCARQGYSETVTGMKRFRRDANKLVTNWENRWLTNMQGNGSVVFKHALNTLRELYKPYEARILVPLHDSIVFEAPKESYRKVEFLTKRVMKASFKEYFPAIKPKVTVKVCGKKSWKR